MSSDRPPPPPQAPRARPTAPDRGPRVAGFALWDGYFGVTYLVTTIMLLTWAQPGRAAAVSVTALTLMVPWYAGFGRGLMRGDRTLWPGGLFGAVLVALFGTATLFHPAAIFALFAMVPMLIMSLPARVGVPAGTLVNMVPVAVGPWSGADVRGLMPAALMGAGLSILLGLWITRMVRQSRERADLIDELRRNRARLAELSREAGVAAERERLAREIHDTLAQGLASVINFVQAAGADLDDEPALARRHLAHAENMAKESLAEARRFVAALSPPSLRDGSLPEAIGRQADDLAARTGITVHRRVEGRERPLPTAAEVVLLRSVQEALANVGKHAGARTVDVRLEYDAAEVRVTVADDGRGFDPADRHDGYGLPGLRARAAEIGGAATVQGAPGGGTTVQVTVPDREDDDGEGEGR
ncbi:sensor histidine kinase [Actinomadura vinacea]|uniref:Sensor histidine kinase n=1 Tax=Actinomadura vinacea TaxID=115336 RepID=A0ABN3JP95_9ACTN